MAGGDGTQAPEPPQSYGDALTGLDAEERTAPQRPDDYRVAPAKPVEPDPEMVRGMVDAALASERTQPQAPAEDVPAEEQTTEEQPRRTRAPLLPAMLRRRQRQRWRETARAGGRLPLRKPSNGSAGMILALVLLALFCILAIQFVVSFVESITGIFS